MRSTFALSNGTRWLTKLVNQLEVKRKWQLEWRLCSAKGRHTIHLHGADKSFGLYVGRGRMSPGTYASIPRNKPQFVCTKSVWFVDNWWCVVKYEFRLLFVRMGRIESWFSMKWKEGRREKINVAILITLEGVEKRLLCIVEWIVHTYTVYEYTVTFTYKAHY